MNASELEKSFQKNFTDRQELGASVSIWKDGEEVLSLAQGWCEREQERPWTQETLVPFYSTTKGLASATVLLLMHERGMTPEDLVCSVWPEFPVKKGTIGQLLSHQLGLAALDEKADVWDYDAVIAAIEKQQPNWQPGSAHGYHPRTFGFLLEELVRRMTGETLGDVWRKKIAEPLQLDAWIGLPESEFDRVARLYPGKQNKEDLESGFYRQLHTPDSLVKRAFSSPRGLHSVREMNEARAWQSGFPAMGGIGTARAVAKFYQAACGAIPFFPEAMMPWMQGMRSCGEDLILCTQTAFSCGFQLDPIDMVGRKVRHHYGLSRRAFGHPGAGGSQAFGDPDSGLSFCYLMNQMELSPLPGAKSLDMIRAMYL
ncbi:beta-lactamase family protein [Verrucomicrobiaceae bacterium R5-34]|uniref:Beta-lactamase family protein n=1 Tax=Oceaniferula flava TaxID=2800421 RepID=A0AAE2VB72_9BACT|nr:serine hydrolase domain-containing protein [Oceaniferula flavus]MBK1829169.1 beta-lactamase family protein [Verrucomicrobiaceae bacterium R5-34]MBK1853406.1 beta-lactamase family protein [Oceaniferula flavus]MBM1134711.1 beta-lactamase family protein [Oceaniferula flavus]